MSKILKNNTGSAIDISDTGIQIPASGQYTIPVGDYLLWAASSDVITEIGSGDVTVNDGSFDLSISDGVDLIKGIFSGGGGGSSDPLVAIVSSNSTDTPLTDGSIFYGAWVQRTTPEMLMAGYSDQDFTWYAQFATTELSQTPATPVYTGGPALGIDSSIPYSYTAGTIEVPVRLQIAREWFRVVIVNTSGADMTSLRFQTSIGKFDSLTQKAQAKVQDDSDVVIVKSLISAETDSRGFVNVGATNEGRLKVDSQSTSTTAAFGELLTTEIRPYVQIAAYKGVNDRQLESFKSGTGSFSGINDNVPGREFYVDCGTGLYGYGVLRSKGTLTYQPGIGSMARFTARFVTSAANSIQRVGLQNIGNELAFGYNNTDFCIFYRTGGRPEIRTLTIDTASNQSTTVTVTLNGVSFTPSVTNASAIINAYEIATGVTYTGWTAYNVDNTVIFQAASVDAKNGTYSAVASSGQFSGTFSQTASGASVVDTCIEQSTWNITTLSTMDDNFIFDPTKGNVFQIQFQYLGYGALTFSIEDPSTGRFIPVHQIKIANNAQTPSIDIPDFKIGLISASLGSTTSLPVYCASMAMFHESSSPLPFVSHAARSDKSGIGTNLTCVLAIKKIPNALGYLNIGDVLIENVTCAAEATKPVFFELRLNPTFTDPTEWTRLHDDSTILSSLTGGVIIDGGELVYSISLSKSSNMILDLTKINIEITNDDVFAICAKASNGSVDTAVSIVWGDR